MKAKKFVGILLAVSIVVTCSFSVSAVTYEHSLQTTQKYSYAPYLSNKTWSHNFNIEYAVGSNRLRGTGSIGVLKGGITKADIAHASASAKNNTKAVHVIARNGTGNNMNAKENFGSASAYVESPGKLWSAIGAVWYHNCATDTDNYNLTYVWDQLV